MNAAFKVRAVIELVVGIGATVPTKAHPPCVPLLCTNVNAKALQSKDNKGNRPF